MNAFWISLLFIALAEMGDKTQLVALAFATRYKASTVLAGVTAATLLVHVVSVALGAVAGQALPIFWLNIVAGIAFIGFGIWTLRGDELDDDEVKSSRFGPFMTVATTFFLAELGDKTMLATITIASQQKDWLGVWLGSTLGMVLADGLAIVVGKVLGKTIPERTVKIIAAVAFLAAGAWTLYAAFRVPR